MRNRSKPVRPAFFRAALAMTIAGLAAPMLIAATPVKTGPVRTGPVQAVSASPPAAQAVSAKPPAIQDRSEIVGWLGLSAGIGYVVAASRRRRQVAAA